RSLERSNGLICLLLAFLTVVNRLSNLSVRGPVIQADEGSYLANAAALAGFENDFASSYSAGYSLLISPVFFSGAQPSTIWIAVKAINAGIYFLLALGVFRLTRSALSAQANCASGI